MYCVRSLLRSAQLRACRPLNALREDARGGWEARAPASPWRGIPRSIWQPPSPRCPVRQFPSRRPDLPRILLRNENDLDLADIRIYRNEIVTEVVVQVARPPPIDDRLFVQGRADTPDHAALQLAPGSACIDDTTGGEATHNCGTRTSRVSTWIRTSAICAPKA